MDTDARAAAAARWRDWLSAAMTKAGMRQVDLVKASSGRLLPAAVSKWMRGEYTATPENAIVAARILNASPLSALDAAGHYELVNALATGASEATWQDPLVARIEGDPTLTPEEKRQLVTAYFTGMEQVQQRILETAELIAKARASK